MERGISLKVIWFDEVEDLLELVFTCSNGYFSGQAELYVTLDVLSKLAKTLTGFPSRPDDFRDFELDTFNPKYADGGARMHFFCSDAAGHGVVDVKLRRGGCEGLGEVQSVALRIPIQAAAVDTFVEQVKDLGKTIGASAFLQQTKF